MTDAHAIDSIKMFVGKELFNRFIFPLNYHDWRSSMTINGESELEVLLYQYARASLRGREPEVRLLGKILG
jgi:hypothetical protein